jgi:tetratricopeptide (TPR) repeat protein
MKNKIYYTLFIICFLTSNLQADYQSDWDAGLKYLKEENFELAEKELTKAIEQLKLLDDINEPAVYVDRGEAYYSLKMYSSALDDLNSALSTQNLNSDQKLRAIGCRMLSCMNLGLDYSKDSKEIDRIAKNSYEINETSMIIKNVPNNEILSEMITTYLIRSGFCETEGDIKILDSGEMVIQKSQNGWGKNLIFKENESLEPSNASS